MSRRVNVACAILIAFPAIASAQGRALQGRADGLPAGIAVPVTGAAAAEEPTATEVNPAGTGFVDGFHLQYFHEGGDRPGQAGDGFWLATPLGRLVPTFAMQWIRPGDGGGARFRKTTFALAAGDGQLLSLGLAGNWFSSPDRALDALWTFDAGATVRPSRHLSFGVSVLGLNSSAARPFPVQLDLGVATRFWRDRLTVSADVLGDDAGRNDLGIGAGAVGVGAEIVAGVALRGQVQFPLRSRAGPAGSTYGQLALVWNAPHVGVTAARGSGTGAGEPWLLGARLSTERYRSAEREYAPHVDLGKALSRRGLSWLPDGRDRYATLLRRLARVRDDPAAAALIVTVDDLSLGHGRIEELRTLLLQVKARKPVLAYLTGGGLAEYYLATAASRIVMPPSSILSPSGLASSTFFVKDTLARIGVAADVVAVGAYKNAPDPLVRSDMSEAQREVTTSLLDDVFRREVRGIAAARGLSEDAVVALVDRAMFTADEAVAARLVDASAWPDEIDGLASAAAGHRVRSVRDEDPGRPRLAQRWGRRPAVAVVRVEGAIAPGESRATPFGAVGIAGADTIRTLLKRAGSDRDVVAIVLRIDSPGGDGTASDLVWREVMQARRSGKPVVVSMGDVAASGGYLVASAADTIVAEPSTLTGSIGVFALKPDLSGLLEKLGARRVTVKRGQHADIESPMRGWTAEERAIVEKEVRAFYDLFLRRVAEGRRMSADEVDRVGRGRVWTGAQAHERGLVDTIGSLEDAVRIAQEKAGRAGDDVEVRRFEPPQSFLGRLASALSGSAESPATAALARATGLGLASALLEMGPIYALPLEWAGAVSGRGGVPEGAPAGTRGEVPGFRP